MSIYAECDQCQKKYRLQDHLAGRWLPCKNCGAEFHVPEAETDEFDTFEDTFAADADDMFELDPSSRKRRPGRRASQSNRNSSGFSWNSKPWIIAVGALLAIPVLLAVVLSLFRAGLGQNDMVDQVADETAADELFAIESVPTPEFPELGPPQQTLPGGQLVHVVDFQTQQQPGHLPGSRMKLRVYLPPGNHGPGSLGCVLVAPAGTTLLTGSDLDDSDYHDETLPYAKAGMAVVLYSLDGPIDDVETAANAEVVAAYKKFSAACAGLVNGRNALEFVLARMPQVDANRIYTAGHSSAGTLSLLLAEHEPRVKACIAYAPATNLEKRMADLTADRQMVRLFPRLKDFIKQSSPLTHTAHLKCPVFLFHARDDSNVSWTDTQTFASRVGSACTQPTTRFAGFGEHYDSMILQGIPRAIDWLRELPGNSGGTQQQQQPAIADSSPPNPLDRGLATTTPRPTNPAGTNPGNGFQPPGTPSRIGAQPGTATRPRPTNPAGTNPGNGFQLPGTPSRIGAQPGTTTTPQRPGFPSRARPTIPSRGRPTIPNPASRAGSPFPGIGKTFDPKSGSPAPTGPPAIMVYRLAGTPNSLKRFVPADVQQVARKALSGLSWVVAESVKYDAEKHEISFQITGMAEGTMKFRQESDARISLIRAKLLVLPPSYRPLTGADAKKPTDATSPNPKQSKSGDDKPSSGPQ